MKNIQGIFACVLAVFSASPAFSEDRVQMIFDGNVAGTMKAMLAVTADPSRRDSAQQAFKDACQHAGEVYNRLNPDDPASEISMLLGQRAKGTFPVSPDLAKILDITREVAGKLKEPMAKGIKIDLKNNKVTLKSEEVAINITPLLKGYLADVIMNDLAAGGWKDSFLEFEGIYVAKGLDFNGPWKVPVVDATTGLARHAFFYKAYDTAAATVTLDHEGIDVPPADLKSVTVFSKEGACKAQGLAAATYVLGLENARKLLKTAKVPRAVLIDARGQFFQIPAE